MITIDRTTVPTPASEYAKALIDLFSEHIGTLLQKYLDENPGQRDVAVVFRIRPDPMLGDPYRDVSAGVMPREGVPEFVGITDYDSLYDAMSRPPAPGMFPMLTLMPRGAAVSFVTIADAPMTQ